MGGRKPLTIEYFQEIARSKGGECLSTIYVNNHTKIHIRCSEGHEWWVMPLSLKQSNSWCSKCAFKKNGDMKRGNLETYQRISENKGGKCLSTKYINNYTKLLFECIDKHIFEMLPMNVRKGCWCPKCAHGFSERVCREFFETIFEKKFPKMHPDWLVNERGNRIELDGYCEELRLAFEYQGSQHYNKSKVFISRTFEEQQQVDCLKRKLCQENMITLIEVPYIIKFKDMEKYIIEECKRKCVVTPEYENIDYKTLNISSSKKLHECQEHARSKGGLCLSTVYIDGKTDLKWQCKENHVWEATPENVIKGKGTWCPTCGIIKSGISRRKYDIEDMRNIALERGGLCKSPEYLGFSNKLIWQCKLGHIWNAEPRSVICNHTWCRKCADIANRKLVSQPAPTCKGNTACC